MLKLTLLNRSLSGLTSKPRPTGTDPTSAVSGSVSHKLEAVLGKGVTKICGLNLEDIHKLFTSQARLPHKHLH
jgi:hypothetical protein